MRSIYRWTVMLACLLALVSLCACDGKKRERIYDNGPYNPTQAIEYQSVPDASDEETIRLECRYGVLSRNGITHPTVKIVNEEPEVWAYDWIACYRAYAERKETQIRDVRLKVFVSTDPEVRFDEPAFVQTLLPVEDLEELGRMISEYVSEEFDPCMDPDETSMLYHRDRLTEVGEFTGYYDPLTQTESEAFVYEKKLTDEGTITVLNASTLCSVPRTVFSDDGVAYLWLIESVLFENGDEVLGYTMWYSRLQMENGGIPRKVLSCSTTF